MKNGKTFVAALLLVLGIGIMGYPFLSNLIHNTITTGQAKKYAEQVRTKVMDNIQNDLLERIYMDMTAYNKELFESGQKDLSDPFSYEQASFNLIQFGFEENIIGYLAIDKINLTEPIYLGASSENLKYGVTHLTQTSLPVGGNNTNSVIAGHRGMISKAMLRNIHKLVIGDLVSVINFREILYYKVSEVKIINPSDIQEILIQPGRDLLTLISCNPLGGNYERYVVYCERVKQ